MPPVMFLGMMIAVTAVAAATEIVVRNRRRRKLSRLANQWDMHYAPGDLLHLAAKVAQNFPIPGAANLRVTDLIYGLEQSNYRYIFTAQYTLGVLRTKKRYARAASWTEPRERAPAHNPAAVILAPDDLEIYQQYEHLAPQKPAESNTPAN